MYPTPFSYEDFRFFFPAEHFHNRCNDRTSAIHTFFSNVQKSVTCPAFNIGLIHVFEVVNICRGPRKWFNARVQSTRVLTILRASADVNDRKNVN